MENSKGIALISMPFSLFFSFFMRSCDPLGIFRLLLLQLLLMQLMLLQGEGSHISLHDSSLCAHSPSYIRVKNWAAVFAHKEEEEEDNSKVMKQHTLEHVREGFCRHWEPRYGPRTGDSRAMTAYLPGKKEETHVIFFHLG
ncbi:hypothetical protein HPP92_001319 [Vanilla planifolia]|uniref:Uncharacterized protein n=1 Tax=Vanilla planifolia TaxID=51239 RepID=A0A835VJJ6_VANPL|nr:hypothetical protein HPP92_001319 [Vanilla planifolia]